jgi:methylmalonyl-CoA mutase cobalamin-binding domain/chain
MVNLEELSRAVVAGDIDVAEKLTKEAIEEKIPVNDILNMGLVPGLQQVGELFEKGDYYLPELIVSGDAVARALEHLEPLMGKEGASYMGRYLIGTVQGDVHDLGKSIVIMMLRGNGWEVTDLGVDVSPEEFCSAVADGDYNIVGMSSLLTMTMTNAGRIIDALKAAGLRDKVKVMVGGAPTTAEWAAQIGADAHAKDGPMAAIVAAKLVGESGRSK